MFNFFKKKEKVFCTNCKHFERNSKFVVSVGYSEFKSVYTKKEDGSGILMSPELININFDMCTKNIKFKNREDAYTATGVIKLRDYYSCTNYDICQKKNKNNKCKDFEILEKESE